MTQAPYYPPQQPQGYPAQPQQPYAPPIAQGYPQQPMAPGYPPQGYAQPPMQGGYPGQAPGPVAPPVQAGNIDDYYNQPVAAGGPGISWKDKPIGTTYVGVIASAPNVQQDSDYTTKLPKFQRDGVTPQWVMLIPLERVQSNYATPNGQPEHPTGEVVFYARGKDKEELNRAVAEAGCSGAPQVGGTFQVTLVERKPQRQGNPKNVVRIQYTPPNGQVHQAQAPVQQEAVAPSPTPAQPQAPAPQPAAPQQFQPQAPAPQPVAQQEQPPQWAQPQAVPQGIPAGVPQAQVAQPAAPASPGPVPPAGMAPETAQILAGLGVPAQQG